MTRETRSPRNSLIVLSLGPTIWAVHFLASYVTAAIWCEKAGLGATLSPVQLLVGIFTLAALVAIGALGLSAWRHWGYLENEGPPHDADTEEERGRFLGLATLLLSGLSFVAVIYVALPVVFIADCR
ncbi:transmembrane prediction [Marinimicrococcus flavescens]|uniref:Uncharacterized protein n=1 Tax=Marinimicrococcus flavescens TaxID=3031815 RepID=A0AAP4D5Q9_9PROT|nr:hypothetical protein [Marinimicrococcus flavescens]